MKSFKAGDKITFGKHKGLTNSDSLTRHHRGELIKKGDRLQQGYAIVWTGR